MEGLLKHCDRGIGVYSGSRRVGYMIKNKNIGLFPSKSSLINLLNERPAFILINRILEVVNKDGTSEQ